MSNKCHGKANIGAFAKDKIDILGGGDAAVAVVNRRIDRCVVDEFNNKTRTTARERMACDVCAEGMNQRAGRPN